MHSNSTTVTFARVASHIQQRYGGTINRRDLKSVLSEYGTNQLANQHINNLVAWGYLHYDPQADTFKLTEESQQKATITLTIPRLNAKEIRRDIVQRYAAYDGVIAVGDEVIE